MTHSNHELMKPFVDAHQHDLRKEADQVRTQPHTPRLRKAIGQGLISLGERVSGVRPPRTPSVARERLALP